MKTQGLFHIIAVLLFTVTLGACGSQKDSNLTVAELNTNQSSSDATFISNINAPAISSVVTMSSRTRRYCGAESNQVCLMTRSRAALYCRSVGGHLPTAREWAQYSMSLGATGLREPQNPDVSPVTSRGVRDEMLQLETENYFVVYRGRRNRLGLRVPDFYFNHLGYSSPSQIYPYYWVAPSSGVNTFSELQGWIQNLITEQDEELHHLRAVRCIEGAPSN